MPQQPKRRIIITALCAIVLLLLAFKRCIFYEDGEDPFLNILMRGELTGGVQNIPNSFGAWIGLTHLLTWLMQMHNNFDWYSLLMVLGYTLLLFQLAYIIPVLHANAKKITSKWVIALVIFGAIILFSENFIFWQLTRLSLFLSAASVFRLLPYMGEKGNNEEVKLPSAIFSIACFAYAALIRPEPAALSLVIWLPLMGLGMVNKIPVKRYLTLLAPVVIIAVLSQILNTPFNKTDRDYLEFRKYQFSLFDFQQPAGTLKFADEKDSITYIVCRRPFITDSSRVNTVFFKRIGLLPLDKTVSSILYYFKNLSSAPSKIKTACQKLMAWNPGFAFLYLLFMFGSVAYVYTNYRKSLWWYLPAQLFPLLLVLGITSFMKMENRVLIPLMWCFMAENLILFGALVTEEKMQKSKTGFALILPAVLIILPFCLDISKTAGRYKAKTNEYSSVKKLTKQINERPEKIIVISENLSGKIYERPFDVKPLFRAKTPLVLENFMLYWLPGYQSYTQAVCGGSNLLQMVSFIQLHKNEVLIAGQADKLDMLKCYLKIIYNVDLNYERAEDLSPADHGPKVQINRNALYRII